MLRRTHIVALAVLAACSSPPTGPDPDRESVPYDPPMEVAIRYGREVRLEGSVFRVAFSDVTGDSRCPVDVTCVWAGNAAVVIGLTAGMGPTVPVELNTNVEPTAADQLGLRLSIIGLRPAAHEGQAIDKQDYVMTIRIEEIPSL